MEYIYNTLGNRINICECELISNKGNDYIVYRYLKSAIKIQKNNNCIMNIDKINLFKDINTKRILLPTGAIYDENHDYLGYEMPYINVNNNIESKKIHYLIEELKIIKEDLELLCNNKIILRDINIPNTVYNDGLYLIDPGNYIIDELNSVIYNPNVFLSYPYNKMTYLLENNSFDKIPNLINTLSDDEKIELIKIWNYNKINMLIETILLDNINDSNMYRQVIQFFKNKRNENNYLYNLDILNSYFNEDTYINNAINDLKSANLISEDPEYKKLLSFY